MPPNDLQVMFLMVAPYMVATGNFLPALRVGCFLRILTSVRRLIMYTVWPIKETLPASVQVPASHQELG